MHFWQCSYVADKALTWVNREVLDWLDILFFEEEGPLS